MTIAEKTSIVKALVGNDTSATDTLIAVYLDDAKEAILNRRFPFGFDEGAEVPTMYERTQCKLAARYFFRRGAEGEISHNEDGVNRSYKSVNDEDLLAEIVQIAKVR